jgi:lipopolysaccharide/colanic/teichoic acid biosynthesis glycosyltransferase
VRTLDLLAKRVLDVLFSALGAIVASPLWLVASAAILIEDGRPILYKQKRWGRSGSTFSLFKFRTMVNGADRGVVRQATSGDKRITRVGRVLRACGLDELPQVINIFKGELSLVGPRALAVGEVVKDRDGRDLNYEDVPGFTDRLAVRPGLTGPAAIYLPKDAHPLDKLEYDVAYIRTRSLLGDLRLIFLSIWISVTGRWERRDSKVRGRANQWSERAESTRQ